MPSPQETREAVSRSSRRHLPSRFHAETNRRFNEGLSQYGATNHLRPDCAETCYRCGARLIDHLPCNYCPACGCDVRPYNAAAECAEELMDAHNQTAIARERHDWPSWKVEAVAKLCGIGLAIVDAATEQMVTQYLAALRLLPSAAQQVGYSEEDDAP